MAKLRDLIDTVAFVLDEPVASVNVRAMALRKAKLIRSSGRGLNAATMGASDATNLLLACMLGGQSTACAPIVEHVRCGELGRDILKSEPPASYLGLEELPATLGEALEALFAHVLAPAASQGDLNPRTMFLGITRNITVFDASLDFSSADVNWHLWYRAWQLPNRLPGIEAVEDRASALRWLEARSSKPTRGLRSVTETIPTEPLWLIAQTIADRFRVDESSGEEPQPRRPTKRRSSP